MHPKTPKWLQDILDACDVIVEAARGQTRESFIESQLLRAAVERKFEIIWLEVTRPIVEAFVHARTMLDFAVRSGKKLEETPQSLPPAWAAVLYWYNLRRQDGG